MLTAIRENAKGWIAWVIVIMLAIPLGLFGIQNYLGGGQERIAAVVNDVEIPVRDLENQLRERQRETSALGPAEIKALRAEVLDKLVSETVLRQTLQDWAMRPGDEAVKARIRGMSQFQRDGKFSPERYRLLLQQTGRHPRAFDEDVRMQMAYEQLTWAIGETAFVTEAERALKARLENQTRTASYAIVPKDDQIPEIPDAEIEAYYAANQDQFIVPERVKVDYLYLDLDQIAGQIEVSEADLRNYYDSHAGEFTVSEERKTRHILLGLKADADTERQAEVLAKANEISERLQAGEDFAELASEYSEDPGSAPNGGELGWVNRGQMVKPFEAATFALAEGEISAPVKSRFGYHIIQVEEIRGDEADAFTLVRDQVDRTYRRQEAEHQFFEYFERLDKETYSHPNSLEPAAYALEMQVRTSDWLTRDRGAGDLTDPKVLRAAFNPFVLTDGNNSAALEIGTDKAVVLRLNEHQQQTVQPLAEVKDRIAEKLAGQALAKAAQQAGETLVAEFQQSDRAFAEQAEDRELQSHLDVPFKRSDASRPLELIEQVFALPKPQDGKPSYGGVSLPNGDYAVIALTSVKEGDLAALDDTERQVLERRMAFLAGISELSDLVADLTDRADVALLDKGGEDAE